jgi:hypothetical protein
MGEYILVILENFSLSFGRFYTSLILIEGNNSHNCTIFTPDLQIKTSFKLYQSKEDLIDVTHHIFTEARGLVCGDSKGQICITKLNNWKSEGNKIVSGNPLQSEVTALSTRGDIIVAGCRFGFGIWNYNGEQLYANLEPPQIHSISITETLLLIGTNKIFREYQLPATTLQTHNRDVPGEDNHSIWATYDNRKRVKYHDSCTGASVPFRPVIPSSEEEDTYYLSLEHKERDRQEIIVHVLDTNDEVCRFSVETYDIRFLWANRGRIFWIQFGQNHDEKYEIHMVDVAKNSTWDKSFEIAECFSFPYLIYLTAEAVHYYEPEDEDELAFSEGAKITGVV